MSTEERIHMLEQRAELYDEVSRLLFRIVWRVKNSPTVKLSLGKEVARDIEQLEVVVKELKENPLIGTQGN